MYALNILRPCCWNDNGWADTEPDIGAGLGDLLASVDIEGGVRGSSRLISLRAVLHDRVADVEVGGQVNEEDALRRSLGVLTGGGRT